MSISQASRIRRVRRASASLAYGINPFGMLLRYGYINRIS